jgi:hypothetical protein
MEEARARQVDDGVAVSTVAGASYGVVQRRDGDTRRWPPVWP